MPIATPEVYAAMLDKAKAERFAYPAINVTSSQTLHAALRGFAEAGSDGIVQVSTGGAEFLSGATIKNMVSGSLALAAFAAIDASTRCSAANIRLSWKISFGRSVMSNSNCAWRVSGLSLCQARIALISSGVSFGIS